MNSTLSYYDQNAKQFVAGTKDVAFSETQDRFLKMIPGGGSILDFGCGSGRDAKYFQEKGFAVDATDGSEELCKLASEQTGLCVRKLLFEELSAEEAYDGIWACASILHLPKETLANVFSKMSAALKSGGILYTSFKYGTFEGERNGRYFTDYTDHTFREFMEANPRAFKALERCEMWLTNDVRPERSEEKWLNVILRKS